MIVGVLALQGDVSEHRKILEQLGAEVSEVRTVEDLQNIDRLVIPGGESTAITKLLASTGLDIAIVKKYRAGDFPIFGTCAGAIVLAKTVLGKNAPIPLGLLDITIDRNAYGSQHQSFETPLTITGIKRPVTVRFIRAPKISSVGKKVEILASDGALPVLVREGNLLAATFHTEVTGETAVHQLFLDL
jgi:5'-phosphate synthase pdxT subunit